nr:hypothetical protein [Tanacetum cinerariifolium]
PSSLDITMSEFKECVETMEVMDVQRMGLHFTWNQKPKGKDGILRKLEHVLANLEFQDRFMGAHVMFKPYRISDHSPSVLSIPSLVMVKPKPFKFFNIVILDKRLQADLDNDPSNVNIREEEAAAVVAFNEAILLEEKFLKQKVKITWLREGDANTAYFHKMVQSRVSRSRIDVVTDINGAVFQNDDVAKAFINHYEVFLGHAGATTNFDTNNLFSTRLDDNEALNMVRVVSSQEVKSTISSMGNDKSPGPAGFTAAFFKDTWDIIGSDVTKAVYRGVPRCTFKVDIQKAYDTVDWQFLRAALFGFGFHDRMIAWIMECVSTTSFSISINGSLHGFFKRKRGLRQGDPLSPYLFTLVMEVFTLMLHRRVRESSNFTYHRYCSDLDLINLCFADDLFLFAHGDVNSASIIKEALDKFKDASGLNPSMPKSKAYFCNVLNHTKLAILHVLPFKEDRLSVKYLGVPLVSSRLIFRDCKEIIDKLLSLKESLWVKWIHVYKLKNRSFWDIPYRGKMSWSWRKLLTLRPLIRDFIWSLIGDGSKISMWFDRWCVVSPLCNIISARDIARSGFSLTSKVRECIHGPNDWLVKYPILSSIPVPLLNDAKHDVLEWRNSDGSFNTFSVQRMWETIRPRDNEVSWYDLVWFSSCIPRHAVHIWLIMKKILKTQDALSSWDVVAGLTVVCPLCETQPDSHEHLFFDCPFSHQIWSRVMHNAGLSASGSSLDSIVSILMPIAK